MGLLRLIRSHAFLVRLARTAKQRHPDPSVIEHPECLPSGTPIAVYEPQQRRLAACVAVHGVTLRGGQDPRLIHFARTVAHFGTACMVPTLRGLASCRWETSDLDELANVVAFTVDTVHQPVGLIGFSFGGSYALVTAGRREVSKDIPWVIALGAYHDFSEVLNGYVMNLKRKPQSDTEWDETIYQRLAFLYGQRDRVNFSQEVRQEIETLLKRYCSEASLEEKRRFYDHYLLNLDTEVFKPFPDPEVLRKLSPAGNLEHLACPVTLIHDRHDQVVPAAQAESLFHELKTHPGGKNHRLVLTSLLSHVSASSWLNGSEIIRLARALSPLIP